VSERGRRIGTVSEAPAEDVGEGTSETIYTNPWIAEYKRRQAMLMEMRAFEVIAMMRDLNLTSYAFSKNAEELQAHIWRYPEIGQSQPFNPDVGDPFGIELARLLANFLGSVKSLISGQRAVLRDNGCGRCPTEHHRECPRAAAGRSPGRTHRGGRREAVGARLDPAVTPPDLLQGGVPPGGVARQQAYPDREAVPGAVVPLAAPYVRELVPRGGHPAHRHRGVMGHRDVKTTLTVYAHLINTDDHTGNMAALGALATKPAYAENVVPLWG
jgi:hypothetical protein